MLQSLTFERAKELLIIIPAAHIFLCFCYLFFYYSSFGHGIWLYTSPTDVFSVSFSDVAPGYLALVAGLAVGHYAFSDPFREPVEKADAPPYLKFIMWTLGASLAFSFALAVVAWIRTGFLLYNLLLGPIAILVGFSWGNWGRKLTTNVAILNIGMFASMAIVAMAFRGLSDGQSDRAGPIAAIGTDKPTCGDKTILRALSSNYLAAAPDNSRIIIDEDCKVKFTLFPAKKFVPRPDKPPIELALY